MTRTRTGLLPGLLLALALAVAACSGSGDKTSGVASLGGNDKATPTTRAGSQDPKQKALAYARCMRQHGIDIPDPKPGGGIDMRGSTASPDSPKFKAAEQACQQYQPNRDKKTQSNGGSR